MLKSALLILLTLFIAIGGGAGSVWYALQAREGVGAITVGGWTAYPDIGTPAADPYSKARIAREGVLALGRAEGLTFVAERDSSGAALRQECAYQIEGSMPVARFWTLYAADRSLDAVKAVGRRVPAVHSDAVLRLPDNSVSILAGRHPRPGNWLAVDGSGPMAFVLTLYDTPIATSTGLGDIELPQILRAGCDA
jgi:hypothetical protein